MVLSVLIPKKMLYHLSITRVYKLEWWGIQILEYTVQSLCVLN